MGEFTKPSEIFARECKDFSNDGIDILPFKAGEYLPTGVAALG
jgi:hypothetical protein